MVGCWFVLMTRTGTVSCAWRDHCSFRKVTADACVFPGSTWSKFHQETSEYQAIDISADNSQLFQQGTFQQLKPLPVTQPASGSVTQGASPAEQTEGMSASPSKRSSEKDPTQSKILLCEYCDASFTSTGGLWLHKASEHFKRKFVCNICGKVLKRKENLINHMKTHSSPYAQECPVCHVYFGPKDIHLHNCAKHRDNPSSS